MPPEGSNGAPVAAIRPPMPVSADDQSEKGGEAGKLASRVARLSGLEKREVIRRANRKKRALGAVSLEVAMLLLAREQNLEMGDLAEET